MSDEIVKALPNVERDKLQAVIEGFRRNMPQQMELLPLIAKYQYAKFVAYCNAGFSEDQAMKLCVL